MEKALTISKVDAAKRQIETVIRLYFVYGDPVSIHTLTAASYNILKDLNKKRGGTPVMVKEQMLNLIKKEHRKEIRDLFNAAENFFKHAERDPENTLDFNPLQSELMIYEACSLYRDLSGEYPPLFKLFQGWFIANNPHYFILPEEQKNIISRLQPDIIRLGREGYFKDRLPLVMKLDIQPIAAPNVAKQRPRR